MSDDEFVRRWQSTPAWQGWHWLITEATRARGQEARYRAALEWYASHTHCLDGHEAHVAIEALAAERTKGRP